MKQVPVEDLMTLFPGQWGY